MRDPGKGNPGWSKGKYEGPRLKPFTHTLVTKLHTAHRLSPASFLQASNVLLHCSARSCGVTTPTADTGSASDKPVPAALCPGLSAGLTTVRSDAKLRCVVLKTFLNGS